MGWYTAPCLIQQRKEFDLKAPGRSRAADGFVGDTSHQARRSDHNPDWSSGGVVRAGDTTNDPAHGLDIHKEFRSDDILRDPRMNYLITNNQMISSYPMGMYPAYTPRPYGGTNPHRHHGHCSIKHGRLYENDTSPWYGVSEEEKLDAETKAKFAEIDEDLNALREALGPDYGASVSKALFKIRRDKDGNIVKAKNPVTGKMEPVYDEHLNVLERKVDELAMHTGVLTETVTALAGHVQALVNKHSDGP